MTTTLAQKTLIKAPTESLSLLHLIGPIGGPHRLILIHRVNGRIVEATDYDGDMVGAFAAEMAATSPTPIAVWDDTDHDTPTCQLRAKWVVSSTGEIAIELLAEKTAIQRASSGDWVVKMQTQPSPVNYENAVGNNSAASRTTAATTALPPARTLALA